MKTIPLLIEEPVGKRFFVFSMQSLDVDEVINISYAGYVIGTAKVLKRSGDFSYIVQRLT